MRVVRASGRALVLLALLASGACSQLTPFSEFHLASRDASADVAPADAAADDVAALDATTDDAADAGADDAPDAPDGGVDDAPDDAAADDVTLDAPAPDAASDQAADFAAPDVAPPCPDGHTRCDDRCVDPTRDDANCGACGNRCAAPHGGAACRDGRCVLTGCDAGRGNCNGLDDDGCEADLTSDANHCGVCGNPCTLSNAVAACVGGACALASCAPGFLDCDRASASGCEVDGRTSATSCGACGRACSAPHAARSCVAGACLDGALCDAGWADCDGAAANGCETDVTTSPANCGRCRSACPSGQSCTAGACTGCRAGTADCDGNALNGCETTLDAPSHCGACTRVCSFANAAASCSAGACVMGACAAGWSNCDGNAANGCEAHTPDDPANCGACGRRCALSHATAGCAASTCTVAACGGAWGDCDRVAVTGCETTLVNSTANCGACGNRCAAGPCRTNACATFGGAWGASDVASCAESTALNPYTGARTCPAGTAPLTFRRIIDCPGRFTGATGVLCGLPGTSSAFGGFYQVVASSCAGSVCLGNAYTGRCTCPAGTTPMSPISVWNDAVCGSAQPVSLVLCAGAFTGAPGFGGAWQRRDDGACLAANPYTGGCACPAGYGAVAMRVITPPPVVFGSVLNVCWR